MKEERGLHYIKGKQEYSGFAAGLMYAAQELAISHGEPSYAMFILRSSSLPKKELLAAQKASAYESRIMNKIIRQATK